MSDNTIQYAIYHLSDNGKTPQEIAKELKTTTKKVNSILSNRPTPEPKTIKPKDLFINETSVKKTKNVSIMTPAASMMTDQLKNNLTNSPKDARMDSTTIFRPLDNQ
jgi:orotate phosphoribosyltransferase-like protein